MNGKQLMVVALGVTLIAGMILFPPWTWVRNTGDDTLSAGYRLIWDSPEDPRWTGHVNLMRLGFQAFVVLAFTAFGVSKLNEG